MRRSSGHRLTTSKSQREKDNLLCPTSSAETPAPGTISRSMYSATNWVAIAAQSYTVSGSRCAASSCMIRRPASMRECTSFACQPGGNGICNQYGQQVCDICMCVYLGVCVCLGEGSSTGMRCKISTPRYRKGRWSSSMPPLYIFVSHFSPSTNHGCEFPVAARPVERNCASILCMP
jgi:hypothetical protein